MADALNSCPEILYPRAFQRGCPETPCLRGLRRRREIFGVIWRRFSRPEQLPGDPYPRAFQKGLQDGQLLYRRHLYPQAFQRSCPPARAGRTSPSAYPAALVNRASPERAPGNPLSTRVSGEGVRKRPVYAGSGGGEKYSASFGVDSVALNSCPVILIRGHFRRVFRTVSYSTGAIFIREYFRGVSASPRQSGIAKRLPGSPCQSGISREVARESFIHAGSRGGCPETPCLRGLRRRQKYSVSIQPPCSCRRALAATRNSSTIGPLSSSAPPGTWNSGCHCTPAR